MIHFEKFRTSHHGPILLYGAKIGTFLTDQLLHQMKNFIVLPLLLFASVTYGQTLNETLVWLNEEFAINSGSTEIVSNSGTIILKRGMAWDRFRAEDVIKISVEDEVVIIYTMPRKVEHWTVRPGVEDLDNAKGTPGYSSSTGVRLRANHNAVRKGLIHLLKLEGKELKPRKALFKN